MARNEQLIRQHKILEILEASRFGRTLEEIRDDVVDELGLTSLHTRSIRRDLDALQVAGFDVTSTEVARGRVWKLGPRAKRVHRISATASELTALSLGRDLLYPLAGTTFWQGIESFWKKIQEELPSSVWQHYEKYRRVLRVLGMPAKSYADKQGMLKTVNRAILEHRIIEVDYQPVGKPASTRRLEPYGVVFYQSSLYIIAAAHEIDETQERIRHWKLDRFLKATLLDAWFKIPADFNLEQHLGGSLGIFSSSKARSYRIRVSSYAAPWVVEDPWHPQQTIKQQKDGSMILTVPAVHDLEVIPRVLALGAEAEVLSPASCRQAIADTVRRMAQAYQG